MVTRASRLTRDEWLMVNSGLALLEAEIDQGVDWSSEDISDAEYREHEREVAALERLRVKVLQRLL